jgi:hypothetical protein
LCDDAVTDESPEINLLCLENASVDAAIAGGGLAGTAVSVSRRAAFSISFIVG